MKKLFGYAGVDYGQWRALMRVHVMLEYAALLGAYGQAAAMKAALNLVRSIVGLGLIGGGAGVVIWMSRDMFFAATVMTTLTATWISAILLMDIQQSLVMPSDHGIIGFRPVSSRTYMAVRTSAILLQTIEIAALTGYVPVVAFLTRPGGSWRLAAAAAGAMAATSLTVAFTLVGVVGWLLTVMSASSVRRLAAYAGTIAIFGFTAVMMLGMFQFADAAMPHFLTDDVSAADLTLPPARWILCFPPVWFAAWVELAHGARTFLSTTGASLGLGALAASVLVLHGRLSAGYAATVARALDATAKPAGPGPRWSFLRNEARAVALLARNQLRDDMDFHRNLFMGVGVVAMGFVIERMSMTGTTVAMVSDPFVTRGSQTGSFSIAFMAMFIPLGIHNSIAGSVDWEAAWIFTATPARRAALVVATRNVVAVAILAPLLLLMGVWFAYSFGHLGHALTHIIFLGAVGYMALQMNTLAAPAILFSLPGGPGVQQNFWTWRSMLVNGIAIMMFSICTLGLYRTRIGTLAGLIALPFMIIGLDRVIRRRLERKLA